MGAEVRDNGREMQGPVHGGPTVAPDLVSPHVERASQPTRGLVIRQSESPSASYSIVRAGREWVRRPADPDIPSALDRHADHGTPH